ncbi:hypothetical protein Tco_0370102 [Tanacetum coccineum]
MTSIRHIILEEYPYLKTLKNSRPLLDFEEYAISTSADTPYMILWSNIKKNMFSANTPYPEPQYSVLVNTPYWSILRIGQYLISEDPIHRIGQYAVSKNQIWRTVFGVPPFPFNYPIRRLTIEKMLGKFINEGKREHEKMEIFIKEFRTTNELLLNTRSNLLSELKIEVKELSKVEKPHDDGEKNKSSSIRERTTQPLVKPQQSSIPFPNQVRKEKEEALQRNFLENLKQLDINIPFIEALVQIPKYAKYLKILPTNKSRLEEACTETMNEMCSDVLLNKLPLKEKDHRSFTIPCQVLEKHKEAEDLTTYHLSMFENPHMEVLTEREIANKFSDKHLMVLKSNFNNDEPWYENFVNYIVGKVVPPN